MYIIYNVHIYVYIYIKQSFRRLVQKPPVATSRNKASRSMPMPPLASLPHLQVCANAAAEKLAFHQEVKWDWPQPWKPPSQGLWNPGSASKWGIPKYPNSVGSSCFPFNGFDTPRVDHDLVSQLLMANEAIHHLGKTKSLQIRRNDKLLLGHLNGKSFTCPSFLTTRTLPSFRKM